eukprot:UN02261
MLVSLLCTPRMVKTISRSQTSQSLSALSKLRVSYCFEEDQTVSERPEAYPKSIYSQKHFSAKTYS